MKNVFFHHRHFFVVIGRHWLQFVDLVVVEQEIEDEI